MDNDTKITVEYTPAEFKAISDAVQFKMRRIPIDSTECKKLVRAYAITAAALVLHIEKDRQVRSGASVR